MPHLVERDDDLAGAGGRLGESARLGANPIQDRDIADAENAGDGAKAHIAHGVKQHRQRLHRGRFAARRRAGEIASAGLAQKTLRPAYNSVPYMITRAAALAANPCHGSLVFPLKPDDCHENG